MIIIHASMKLLTVTDFITRENAIFLLGYRVSDEHAFFSSINQKIRVRGARVLLQCIYIRPPHTHYDARGARETPERRRFYSKRDLVYSPNKHVEMGTARADPDIRRCRCISMTYLCIVAQDVGLQITKPVRPASGNVHVNAYKTNNTYSHLAYLNGMWFTHYILAKAFT